MEKEQALEIYTKAKADVKKRVEENENGSNFIVYIYVKISRLIKRILYSISFVFFRFGQKNVSVLKSLFKLNYSIVYLAYVVCVSLV